MPDISRFLDQTCVYWPPGEVDYNGQKQFGSPVELACRWVEASEVFLDSNGNQQVSHTKVRLDADVLELGVLWEGTLATKSADPDPFANSGAYEIRKYRKIPSRRATEFLRIALL